MNILHIINNLDHGGAEKLLLQMAAAQRARGHVVKVVCIAPVGGLEREAEKLRVPVITLGQAYGVSIPAILRLARIIHREKADIVHNHNPRPQVYGSIAARLAGTRNITTRHGNERKSLPGWVWRLTDQVVFISRATEAAFLDAGWVKPSHSMVIHNGIDLTAFTSSHSEAESRGIAELGGPSSLRSSGRQPGISGTNSSHRIGIVARLALEKDIGTLIEAFHIVQRSRSNSELVIVGDGGERKKLESLAEGAAVHFLGTRNDIPDFMRSFDVYALSSLSEGISLTLLEAMAASKPIVATNVGGNPEVVVDGETGFLVPPQDPQAMAEKVLALLRNPALAQKMGQAGRKRVEEHFSLEAMVDQYEQVYREVLGRI